MRRQRLTMALVGVLSSLGWGCPGNDSPIALDAAIPDTVVLQEAPVACQIGTPDHCTACGSSCPGVDNHSTTRRCLGGRCDIACRADWYDVNGDPQDGCEVEDNVPPHDSLETALDLNDLFNNGGVINDNAPARVVDFGRLPSDDREHLDPPVGQRPDGRPDWYRMSVMDIAFSAVDGIVELDVSRFPASARFRVQVAFICDAGSEIGRASEEGNGGSTITVMPSSTDCPGWSDDGDYVVSVTKLSGPHSAASYELSIEP